MTTYSATFSPDDGKLRLYASSRLDSEIYAEAKRLGFRWAPKQDLFFAPSWTPAREDFLIKLAGEVGDEDTSLVERAEERAERFEDYGDKRAAEAQAAREAVDAIADNIPLGQPILVGHHSENHARKDAEKIENGMRKAIRLWETSGYWKARAEGAIRHAKYKERPDVRARRIKTLEAEKRKVERTKADLERRLKLWTAVGNVEGPEKRRDLALRVANDIHEGGVKLPNGEDHWSAWSAMTDGKIDADEVRRQRLENIPKAIPYWQRWIDHYDGRLTYERAMLAEAGGTVADKDKPEKGGACRCWASPGYGKGWSYIKKVNKVSVTVEDNWGNGGANFTRTIPFDKLKGVMSPFEVAAAKAEGRVVEAGNGTGFYLTDATTEPPKPRPEPERTAFDDMKDSLKAGVKVVAAPNLFPTPLPVALEVVKLADIGPGDRVLEPSAGTGKLIEQCILKHCGEIVAVEINPQLAEGLRCFPADVRCGDFLEHGDADLGDFDKIVMNPPFENGIDIKHVEHALKFLRPGGRLVAIVAGGPRQERAFKGRASHWEELPSGTFAGTGVRAVLMAIDKDEAKLCG